MNCQELTEDDTDNNYQAFALSSSAQDLSAPSVLFRSIMRHLSRSPDSRRVNGQLRVLYEMLHGMQIKPAEVLWGRDRNITANVINQQNRTLVLLPTVWYTVFSRKEGKG